MFRFTSSSGTDTVTLVLSAGSLHVCGDAGPGDYSVIEVGFLDGNQTPTVEEGDLDFSTLGYAVRACHDFGVSFLEYRGGVLAAGD
jgi:hypothetical protein